MSAPTWNGAEAAHLALPTLGRGLAADRDHALAALGPGHLVLLHVPPGDWPWERHAGPEFLVCLQGRLQLQCEGGPDLAAGPGEMLALPPGLAHRFAPSCNAVLLVLTQASAA